MANDWTKAGRQDAFQFFYGNSHSTKTRFDVRNLPLQDAFANRAFLEAQSFCDLAPSNLLGFTTYLP